MDLKDVVQSVRDQADEAHRAFHAGHPENSNLIFKNIMEEIRAYFVSMSPKEVAALEETTSEKSEATLSKTQAPVPGHAAKPAGVVPFADPSKPLPASQFQTPDR